MDGVEGTAGSRVAWYPRKVQARPEDQIANPPAEPVMTVSADFAGTVTTIAVLVQDRTFAVSVPKITDPEVPKPLPRIVTVAPTAPWRADNLLM